uniref:Uncharacterized protein n=1 Tax=Romanomermis culicivorax TaxID=13658 RepID=A0A915LAS4_ROMCU
MKQRRKKLNAEKLQSGSGGFGLKMFGVSDAIWTNLRFSSTARVSLAWVGLRAAPIFGFFGWGFDNFADGISSQFLLVESLEDISTCLSCKRL